MKVRCTDRVADEMQHCCDHGSSIDVTVEPKVRDVNVAENGHDKTQLI